jgi:hypothetical protein
MAPAKPLQLVWAGVNRLTYEGQVAGPQHRVPLEVALRAITIDAAYSIRQEKEIGSIEVGKQANLTVLQESPYDAAPDRLKDIAVWGTMLEGWIQPALRVESTLSRRESARTPEEDMIVARSQQSGWTGSPQFTPTVTECRPGCSCRLSQTLAGLIVGQLETERP